MINKMNEFALKGYLYNEIGRLETKETELENEILIRDILMEIVEILNSNIENIADNLLLLNLQIPLVCTRKAGMKIYDKLYDIVYMLNGCKKIMDEEEFLENRDYKKYLKCFNSTKHYFEEELNKINIEIENINKIYNFDTKISCRKTLTAFKYNQVISEEQIVELSKTFEWSNLDMDNRIRAIEIIRRHNELVINKRQNSNRISKSQVSLMLDKEFDNYDDIYIEDLHDKKIYDVSAQTYINLINECNDVDEIETYLDKPSEMGNEEDILEYDYIMTKIIKYYQQRMIEIREMIYDKDFYIDEEYRDIIVEDFNTLVSKYNRIRYIYNIEKYKYEREIVSNIGEKPDVNNVFYASPLGSKKTYLENDMEDATNENLDILPILIKKLKTNTLTTKERKTLNENKSLKKARELRKGQIRIFYFHLNNNNYLIVGVGTKKDNNDMNLCTRMAKRNRNINIEEISEQERAEKTYQKMLEYVKENKRSGNR